VLLFHYALKHRWVAREIESTFSKEDLTRIHRPLKIALKAYPRRWAATELALAIGPRFAASLHYLSTRPFAKTAGARFDALYHSWPLPKRKGGTRLITAPKPLLKALQRAILHAFFENLPLHAAATGFRKGISIADNARPHVGKPVVVNVDISGFFSNTRFPLIARAIENALPKYLSIESRRLVTDICSYNGVLPTGAPTSPAIANLVLLRADRAIGKVAARHDITYTRYADDLTFSGEVPLSILPFVREVLNGLGYQLDQKKTNIFRKGRRQVVTGLVVNQKVSVPRLMRRKLRAAVHRATHTETELTWHKVPMNRAELEGRIAFTAIAHREEAKALFDKLRGKREKPDES
jgi:retron-type reverse transcriptase